MVSLISFDIPVNTKHCTLAQPTSFATVHHDPYDPSLYLQMEKVLTALPITQANLATASQQADEVLSEVKKLEIRAMLTDQTIEEMEAQLYEAHNMSANTAQKAEDMARKLQVRSKELGRAQDRAEQATSKLEQVTNKLRAADIKVRTEGVLCVLFQEIFPFL